MQKSKPTFVVILGNTLIALIILFVLFFALLKAPDSFWQFYNGTFKCISLNYVNIPFCSLEVFVDDLKLATGVLSRTYETLFWGTALLTTIVYHLLKYEIK